MTTILRGVRPLDVALTLLLGAAATFIAVENMAGGFGNAADLRHPLDTTSWLLVPGTLAVVAPILWRRRDLLTVIGVTLALMGLHVLAFGWAIRCGWALPLTFALSYAVGRLIPHHPTAVVAVVGIAAIQGVSLLKDSLPGLEIMPVTMGIALVFWGIGALVRRAATRRSERAHQTMVLTA